jgi:tetratricopeptide (TPR) repeat protein
LQTHEAFARADEEAPLEAEDLELWTTALLMLGRDDHAIEVLERAHHRYVERGESLRAVHAATWIGMNLAYRGAVGPASGWLGRAQRLLDNEPDETAERGYLLIPLVFRHEAAGEFEAAAAVAGQAAAIGERHGDLDLFAIALHAQGHMLARAGHVSDGLALLDEAMVTVTASELSPFVVGLVYCGVILACQEIFEVGRAREWTLALTEWAAQQSDLVAFTGRCLVHRSEILQLSGSWSDALDEVRLAGRRFEETKNPAGGVARYREAELLRLRGEFAAAEDAYHEASRLGWEPQPGLASYAWHRGSRT